MGLHSRRRRRHESSPGNFPPLFPPSISIPSSPLLHRTRHESSPGLPFPPLSPPPPVPESLHNHHESPSPLTSRNRRDSYPGPFPSFLSPSSSDPPTLTYHTRNETCPGPFFDTTPYHHESDDPSSTSSSPFYHYTNKSTLDLYGHEQEHELSWPFDKLSVDGLDHDDIKETAYEIFFTACRSSPGFGGRSAITFYSKHDNNGNEGTGSSVPVSQTSRVKRALGLKMLRSSLSQRIMMVSDGEGGGGGNGSGGGRWSSAPSSPMSRAMQSPGRPRRQMTMADVMRVQMRVSEQSDSRLRKTLMRTLVGQLGRQAETIILPLELLRHLKPSEFNDSHEYHLWQKRQLKILEAGILLHPSIPVENTNTFAMNLRDIIRSAEAKPLDTGKNSDTMRTFSNSVVSLAMRSPNGAPTNICHWANGYPVNIHLYMSLLQSIFDLKDETSILDEVDELLDLMKKTWSTLGINRPIHNVCFTWLLFQKYVVTGQIEPDLLCASHAMLTEVENDARKEKESLYVKMLASVLSSLQGWAEKRLLNYHDYFQADTIGQIENLLPLVLAASKILGYVTNLDGGEQEKGDKPTVDFSGDKVDNYIRSSMKNAFYKIMEASNANYVEFGTKKDISQVMLKIAQEIEDLAMNEKDNYSLILKKWHTTADAVAALTLNNCFGDVLTTYLSEMTSLTVEVLQVLQRAKKLEDILVQMVVEDCADCEDGGKTVVREMVPYEVDSTILNLMRKWIDESLNKGAYCLQRAKENETWNPKSKSEPYGKTAVELMNFAKITVQEFFRIPTEISEDLVQELAGGLEKQIREYTMFVAACGLKENYIPSLPSLTRCYRDSKLQKLLKIASPCSVSCEEPHLLGIDVDNHPHSCTSRGTQRLYIRLNTLHYLLTHIASLDKSLTLTPGIVPSKRHGVANKQTTKGNNNTSYFESANSSIQAACKHVSEVASYRLIFLDSAFFLYDGLYVGDVANGRINHALTILKHNIKLMTAILTEEAHALAVKEVMKASFDAFLMVLLAGGASRAFNESDHQIIQEDFQRLKQIFHTVGQGLVAENVVEKEGEVVEGVIGLMGMSTEQLMENLSIVTSETSGVGTIGNGHKLPMPPTTGKWNREDPDTILRVLCYRNDRAANHFLKRTFQIPKRR
ncbi:hypothetical protein TanjilG_06152 [Lupinus angustifolius]|uniref:MHD1 domain-containing protein n=1 Tax=Lupinus angustifolius TaxID=3871 RepID=A0A394DEZ9_LUPAN|nr:PREDICTED: uncharacterized protein LOC109340129 [Lupinus angustifolius]OIW21534.1 hypothetical protein TanjilG_06152 [Lupinus angustifolius]